MWSPHCVSIILFSEVHVKGQGRRSPKGQKRVLVISRRRIVVESRDWCHNDGEINNFYI